MGINHHPLEWDGYGSGNISFVRVYGNSVLSVFILPQHDISMICRMILWCLGCWLLWVFFGLVHYFNNHTEIYKL